MIIPNISNNTLEQKLFNCIRIRKPFSTFINIIASNELHFLVRLWVDVIYFSIELPVRGKQNCIRISENKVGEELMAWYSFSKRMKYETRRANTNIEFTSNEGVRCRGLLRHANSVPCSWNVNERCSLIPTVGSALRSA